MIVVKKSLIMFSFSLLSLSHPGQDRNWLAYGMYRSRLEMALTLSVSKQALESSFYAHVGSRTDSDI